MGVIGAAADEVGLGLDGGETVGVDPGDDTGDFAHHLGADPVAGKKQELVSLHASGRPVLVLAANLRSGSRKC